VLRSNIDHGGRVHTDLDTLATALYVKIDDTLKQAPELQRWRPTVGIAPKLTDAELLTVAVMQALLGYVSEARWLRYARTGLRHLFPYLPRQSGYNKRLGAARPQVIYFIRALAQDTTCGPTTFGSPTPPRSSAAAPARPSNARPCGLGRLRLLPVPLALLLGPAAASGLHHPRAAGRLRAGQSQGR
jgi:hypothetical protein